jgi:hypothetical protein
LAAGLKVCDYFSAFKKSLMRIDLSVELVWASNRYVGVLAEAGSSESAMRVVALNVVAVTSVTMIPRRRRRAARE